MKLSNQSLLWFLYCGEKGNVRIFQEAIISELKHISWYFPFSEGNSVDCLESISIKTNNYVWPLFHIYIVFFPEHNMNFGIRCLNASKQYWCKKR